MCRVLIVWITVCVGVVDGQEQRNASIELSFWPPAVQSPWFSGNGLPTDDNTTIVVNVTITDEELRNVLQIVRLDFDCDDTFICGVVEQQPRVLLFDAASATQQLLVTVRGTFLGYTSLRVKRLQTDPPELGLSVTNVSHSDRFQRSQFAQEPYAINVIPTATGQVLQGTFRVFVITGLVAVHTFMFGTQLKPAVVLAEIRRPLGPAVGAGCQFLLMPLVSLTFCLGWLCARVFLSGQPHLQFGLFCVSCAPGGGKSNMWTVLLEGNLDLSMTMTFLSQLLALAGMPFWLYTVGETFYDGQLYVPFTAILQALATLIIPATAGVLFAHYRADWIPRFRRLIKPFSFALIIIVFAFLAYSSWYIVYLFRWYTMAAGACLPLAGYVVAYSIGWAVTRSQRTARTIAIETGVQNIGVAGLICMMSLPAPANSLTLVMPVSVAFCTLLPLGLWLAGRTIAKRCCRYVDDEVEAEILKSEAQKKEIGSGQVHPKVVPNEVIKAKGKEDSVTTIVTSVTEVPADPKPDSKTEGKMQGETVTKY